MWTATLAVIVGVIAAGAALKTVGWTRRYRALRTVPPSEIRRAARGIPLRVFVDGPTGLPSMTPHRANRTIGDLVLTDDRLILVSTRGVLIDLKLGSGRALHSIRAPAPLQLIVEGRVPHAAGGVASFRIEATLPDAERWAHELEPFREPENGGYRTVRPAR